MFTEASTWTSEAETCPILWTTVSPDDKAPWRAPPIREMRQAGCRAAGMNPFTYFLLTLIGGCRSLRGPVSLREGSRESSQLNRVC